MKEAALIHCSKVTNVIFLKQIFRKARDKRLCSDKRENASKGKDEFCKFVHRIHQSFTQNAPGPLERAGGDVWGEGRGEMRGTRRAALLVLPSHSLSSTFLQIAKHLFLATGWEISGATGLRLHLRRALRTQ